MSVHIGKIELQSKDHMPDFHNVTDEVKKIVAESGIQNGLVTVYSHHTTCSVITQECSHDLNYFGREYLQVDLIETMEKLIPTCRTEGQYHHPGPKHIEFALTFPDAPKISYLKRASSRWAISASFTSSTGTRFASANASAKSW